MKHTKALLIFAISLVCSCRAYAQTEGEEKDKDIIVGIKIYPGFSDTWRSDYSQLIEYSFSPKISLSGGLSFLIPIKANILYAEAEVLCLNRGYKENRTGDYELEPMEILRNDYYLTIPLSVLFSKKWFYMGGGVNMGYLIKRKQIINDRQIASNDLLPNDFFLNWHSGKFLYGIQLKTGGNIEVDENLSLRCELFISPTLLKSTYLNYGLGLGFNYKIK